MTDSDRYFVERVERSHHFSGWTAWVQSRRVAEGGWSWLGHQPSFWRPTKGWAIAAARKWIRRRNWRHSQVERIDE